jgi:hypothetical protein
MPRYNKTTRYDLYVLQDINMLQIILPKRFGDPILEEILQICLTPKSVVLVNRADFLLLGAQVTRILHETRLLRKVAICSAIFTEDATILNKKLKYILIAKSQVRNLQDERYSDNTGMI